MLDVQKAIRFVEQNGTELEKYRLRFLLGTERNDELPLRHLGSLQNFDGSFPYDDEEGRLGSVNTTSVNLGLMIELDLKKEKVCKKTVEYLLKIQCEDGGWDENEAINQYNPPFWLKPRDLNTKMWLTATISNYLIQLEYKESSAIRKAAGFLLSNRDKDGRFTGYLHSTWIAVGVFGQLEGSQSEIVKKALEVIDRSIDRVDLAASNFAWILECFFAGGIPKDNPVAKRCIDKLVELQCEDGVWLSEDGSKFSVAATISALRVLRNYRIV